MRLIDKVIEFFGFYIKKTLRWFKYRGLRRTIKKEQYNLQRSLHIYKDCDTALEIVKRQSRKVNSKIEFAPNSGEFYITNDNEQYIIVTALYVSVINGIYHYDVTMSSESTEYLSKYLKRIVERRRSKSKKYIESKITNSLSQILTRVQN
jgi:hypothetical protein